MLNDTRSRLLDNFDLQLAPGNQHLQPDKLTTVVESINEQFHTLAPMDYDFNFAEVHLEQEASQSQQSIPASDEPRPFDERIIQLLKDQPDRRKPESEFTSLLAAFNRLEVDRLDPVSLLQSVLSMAERGLVVLGQSAVLECSPITVSYTGADI